MASQFLAERLHGLEASPTLALAAKAKALAKEGKPIVDLTAGEPDFPTPEPIKQAAIKAIQDNHTRYTPAAGIFELRKAIANDLADRLGVQYADAEVMVSCGAKHVLYNALQTICGPGDEVIIFSPYWVSYGPLVQLASAEPVIITTREEEQFQPNMNEVKKKISNRTKAIILNSPSNPTGAIIHEDRLKELADILRTQSSEKIVIISDEIYDQIVFEPAKAQSIAHTDIAPDLRHQIILVNGVSKSYSMTGWRIGYAAGPKNIIDAMTTLQSHATSNPTSISQHAALAAITGDQQAVRQMVKEFHRRRDRLVNGLNQLPGLSCVMPEGAFYAWCNISGVKLPASTVAARWLEDALVAVVPGEGFGSTAHVRFSFATSLEAIDQALSRLGEWLSAHR